MPKNKNKTQNQQDRNREEFHCKVDSSIYRHSNDHLIDELRWLNRLLAAYMLSLRQVNFYERPKDFRGLFITDEEIDTLLSAGIFEVDDKESDKTYITRITNLLSQSNKIRTEINQRIQNSLNQNIFLPLVQLSRCFHLNEFELNTFMICLAPQIDTRYEKLYGYLQNDMTRKTPSVDLILNLLCHTAEERLQALTYFNSELPLQRFGLIEKIESEVGTPGAHYFLKADPRITNYVLRNNSIDNRLIDNMVIFPPCRWNEVVIDNTLKSRLQKLFQLSLADDTAQRPIFYFQGRSGVGKKTIAGALCSEASIVLAVVDMRYLLGNPDSLRQKTRLILREGLLQPCAVYFDHLEKLELVYEENPLLFNGFIQALQELNWITFLGSENPMPSCLLDLAPIYPVKIPAPDHTAQRMLWEIHLNGTLNSNEKLDCNQLTTRFDLTGKQIVNAIRLAQQNARVQNPENGNLTINDFFEASRVQSQPRLSALARKIESRFSWDDLVLPDDKKNQLKELANWVKYRQKVLSDWGFSKKLSSGRGINALFVGPSGTGKTMAAEVIANKLELDLYKIDLSAVVSKYIGETEKNLNQIFAEAMHSNAILFFDEADAIFGKRSEVKDAHDRYANVEIAYLLQKMEEYEGLVILATNFRKNMDDAFTRRIHFSIEFPFPTEIYRRRIWEKIWPQETPLHSDLNLDFLARSFEISGGNIRNVALSAVFLAADDGGSVTMNHLIRATQREYQKMGKLCMKADFGKYYNIIQEVSAT